MTTTHQVTFFPVSNGDTVRVLLHGGRRILFDFCQKPDAEDEESPNADVKKLLKAELDVAGCDYFDVVAFTHADLDHIQGSTEFFWLEQAAKYQGPGRIKIRELWVPAAMVIECASHDQQSDEFVILRQEARRRLLDGKGIRVFSDPPKLREWLEPELAARGLSKNARDHLFVDAGTLVPGFSLGIDGVEFFTHSPFKEHCEGTVIVRNQASLIFNVRFDCDGARFDFLQAGDAEWCDLETIVNKTRFHKRDDRLQWDLYNIPHHCSYLALGKDKGEKETEPAPKVKELLLEGRPGCYAVSSSKPVRDEPTAYTEIQPPHIQARKTYERYVKEVDGRKFLVTMEEPNGYKPKPMTFEFKSTGLAWLKAAATGGASIVTSTAPRAG
jgi:hypothetical protein